MKRLLLARSPCSGSPPAASAEQVVVYKQGKYQGKPDGMPWNSESPSRLSGGEVDQGRPRELGRPDQARQLAQHEHKRIYQ